MLSIIGFDYSILDASLAAEAQERGRARLLTEAEISVKFGGGS